MREKKDATATVRPGQMEEGTVATVSQLPNKKRIERARGPNQGDPGAARRNLAAYERDLSGGRARPKGTPPPRPKEAEEESKPAPAA